MPNCSQVTVTALETSKILTWHRDRVKFCLMEDPELQAIFDHVVGRDVVRKLMQVRSGLHMMPYEPFTMTGLEGLWQKYMYHSIIYQL